MAHRSFGDLCDCGHLESDHLETLPGEPWDEEDVGCSKCHCTYFEQTLPLPFDVDE